MSKSLFYPIIIIIVFASCKVPLDPVLVKFTGQTQGTYYAVTYFDEEGRTFQSQIDSLLKILDLSVSLWEPNSILSRINKNMPDVVPDSIFTELFYRSQEIYYQSDGAFDPTIGPLVNSWGFGFSDRMKVNQHVVDSLLPLVGYNKVRLENHVLIKSDPRIQLDFNAIAQGYSVDLVAKFLSSKGISNYLVDIGGEVIAKGKKPSNEKWKVGIEKPADNVSYGEGLQAIVSLSDKALATSGNYRKFYEENGIRYSHTIDPASGYPVKHSLLSVSVLAGNCASADAWATVFMVLGLEKSISLIANQPELEAYFIYADANGNLQTHFTEGFKKILVSE